MADSKTRNRQQGVILILLLWVLAALSIIVFSMAYEVRTEAMATRNTKLLAQAYYNARAGISETIYKLLRTRMGRFSSPAPFAPGGLADGEPTDIELGVVTVDLPTGKAVCEVEDEGGKINVNNLGNEAMLRKLMENIGLESRDGVAIVDAILDFINPGQQQPRAHGAVDGWYTALNPPYRTKKRPFEIIEELLMVRGITPEIFYGKRVVQPDGQVTEQYGLVKYVTVQQTFGQINANAASIPVLMSIPGMTPRKAAEIYERRKVRPFRNTTEIQAPFEAQNKLSVNPGQVYSIKAIGFVNGMEIKRVIRATVSLAASGQQDKTRHRLLYWNENAVY